MVSSAVKYCIQTFLIYNAKLFELHFVHYHRKIKNRVNSRENLLHKYLASHSIHSSGHIYTYIRIRLSTLRKYIVKHVEYST